MLNNSSIHTIVFTDLDGTLLDDRYDLPEAAYMCNELHTRGVLTVPASSKTKAELSELKALLNYDAPLISENGAGIIWPKYLQKALALLSDGPENTLSYQQICDVLHDMREGHNFQFSGFYDLSAEEVAQATGLDVHAAALAKERFASEPITWSDSPVRLADFKAQLLAHGLVMQAGGRFLHIMNPTDKGKAAHRILEVVAAACDSQLTVLACGDSPNDKPMLEMAHACVEFPQRDGSYMDCANPSCVKAKSAGALPWLEAVNELVCKSQFAVADHIKNS